MPTISSDWTVSPPPPPPPVKVKPLATLALLLAFLPVLLIANQTRQLLNSNASEPATYPCPDSYSCPTPTPPAPTPTPTPKTKLGPGEKDTLTITSTITGFNLSTGTVTSYQGNVGITGPEVSALPNLWGRYTDQNGTTTQVQFTKGGISGFSLLLNQYPHFMCMDLYTDTNPYIASFCVRNNLMGKLSSGVIYGASTSPNSTSAPLRVNYSCTSCNELAGYWSLQAVTAPFDKNTPNFIPTNTQWIVQNETANSQKLTNLNFISQPVQLSCDQTNTTLVMSFGLTIDQNTTYRNTLPTTSCEFTSLPATQYDNFTSFNRRFTSHSIDPRLTPSPTPIPPTPTLLPTPEPTTVPTPNPTAIPTPEPTTTPIPLPTPTPIPSTSTIDVYAAGTPFLGTYPTMQLRINGSTVSTWKNVKGDPKSNVFLKFTYVYPRPLPTKSTLRVAYTNDNWAPGVGDRNLRVDKVVVDSVEYQTESANVYGQGAKNTRGTCSNGYLKTEWLYCNGYFSYPLP